MRDAGGVVRWGSDLGGDCEARRDAERLVTVVHGRGVQPFGAGVRGQRRRVFGGRAGVHCGGALRRQAPQRHDCKR